MPNITLPDRSTKELPDGAPIGDALPGDAVCARVDGELVDLSWPVERDVAAEPVGLSDPDGLHVLRHSTAHVMAQAVTQLWPGAKYAIGPPIEDGFYYDFDLPGGAHFTDEDLERIEARMREIVAEDQPFAREEHSRDEGLHLFADQPYKVEIIEAVDEAASAEGAEGSV